MQVDPKNDFAFQWLFGREENKEILLSFLHAVFGLPEARGLTDIDILNTRLNRSNLLSGKTMYVTIFS